MRIAVVTIFFLCLFVTFAFSEQTKRFDAADRKKPDLPRNVPSLNHIKRWDMSEYKLPWIVNDLNKDGVPDVATKVNAARRYSKIVEVLDSNHDGTADDFAHYIDGKLSFQEIDSNFDKKIDLWINILSGKYLKRYQRDIDFDGYVDIDRDFSK